MRVIPGHSRTMSGNGLKMSEKGMKCPELRGWHALGLLWRGPRYDGGAMSSARSRLCLDSCPRPFKQNLNP